MSRARPVLVSFVMAGLAATSAAQSQHAPAIAAPAAASAGSALAEIDGVLWGAGGAWKARFDAGRVEFTPALGLAAPRNEPFALRALSAGRGEPAPLAAAAPRREGGLVLYERGALSERYEPRADGLEQSFVFAAPPAGGGDLVVRLGVETALPFAGEGAGGLRFAGAHGGVTLGAVTGVDADGRTIAGTLRRLPDTTLELALPAAFVDAARWPVVLDPLISPAVPVGDSGLDEEAPDAAWDDDYSHWMVVWQKDFSAVDQDIRGAFLDSDGALLDSWIIEVASDTLATAPAVATLAPTARFVVVWQQSAAVGAQHDILACSISSAGWGQSSNIFVSSSPVDEIEPDVGGHSSSGATAVSVIWIDGQHVWHRNVFAPLQGEAQSAATIEDVAGPYLAWKSKPAISKSGGDARRFLVTWMEFFTSPAPGDYDLYMALIDEGGQVLVPSQALAQTIGPSEHYPDVDGDGQQWVVGFAKAASLLAPTVVRSSRVDYTGGQLVPSPSVLLDDVTGLGGESSWPSVAFTGNCWLVAWTRALGAGSDIGLSVLDPLSCKPAEATSWVELGLDVADSPAVCSRYGTNHLDPADHGLVAFDSLGFISNDLDVQAALVDPQVGVVYDLGGASPLGGKAGVTAAALGNSSFAHTYAGLYASNPVMLLIGVFPLDAPFCAGVMRPDPLLFLPFTTNADGKVLFVTPLPDDAALIGLALYEQWAETDVTAPCGKHVRLSNGLAVTLE